MACLLKKKRNENFGSDLCLTWTKHFVAKFLGYSLVKREKNAIDFKNNCFLSFYMYWIRVSFVIYISHGYYICFQCLRPFFLIKVNYTMYAVSLVKSVIIRRNVDRPRCYHRFSSHFPPKQSWNNRGDVTPPSCSPTAGNIMIVWLNLCS